MEKSVKEIVAEIKEKMDKLGGLKHVYFVACGGSKAAIFPGLYLLQSEAKTFSATTYTSNEFVHATPKELDERCVAVICSLKATPETVEAVKTANAAGAVTIAMTGNMQTGMAKVGQYIVTYSNGDDQVYSDSNQANSLRIGFELLKQFENWENYDKAMEAYRYIDEIIEEGKKNVLADAKRVGHPHRTSAEQYDFVPLMQTAGVYHFKVIPLTKQGKRGQAAESAWRKVTEAEAAQNQEEWGGKKPGWQPEGEIPSYILKDGAYPQMDSLLIGEKYEQFNEKGENVSRTVIF